MSDSLPKMSPETILPAPPPPPPPPMEDEEDYIDSPKQPIDRTSATAEQLTGMKQPQVPGCIQKPHFQKSRKETPMRTKQESGRISAKEYRKVVLKCLLFWVKWGFALPMVICIFFLLCFQGNVVESLLFSLSILCFWFILIEAIYFFSYEMKRWVELIKRLNDLGWNGGLVFILTLLSGIVIAAISYDERGILIGGDGEALALPGLWLVWCLVLEGHALFAKGSPESNKYGPPCR